MRGFSENVQNVLSGISYDRTALGSVTTDKRIKTKKSIVANSTRSFIALDDNGTRIPLSEGRYMLTAWVYAEDVATVMFFSSKNGYRSMLRMLEIPEENTDKWIRFSTLFTTQSDDYLSIDIARITSGKVYINGFACYKINDLEDIWDTNSIEEMEQLLPYIPHNKDVSRLTYISENQIPIKISIQTTLRNGSQLTIENEDISADNFEMTSDWGNDFPVGAVTSKSLRFEIMNIDDKYTDIDFRGAKIKVNVEYLLYEDDEIYESILIYPEEYLCVNTSNENGYILLECNVSAISKLNKLWQTKNKEYVLLDDVIAQIKTDLGITVFNEIDNWDSSLNPYFAVLSEKMYNNYTYLQILQMFAISQNAYIDFVYNDEVVLRSIRTTNTINPITHAHQYYDDCINISYGNEIVVTGAKYTYLNDNGNEEGVYSTGNNNYMVDLSAGSTNFRLRVYTTPQNFINTFGAFIIGGKLTPFTIDIGFNPYVECGDLVSFMDDNFNIHYSIVTAVSTNFNGMTTVKCSVPIPEDVEGYTTQSSQIAAETNMDVLTTEWITMPIGSDFKLNNTSQPVQVRRIGKNVYVRGVVNPKAEITADATLRVLATLPADCIPSRNSQFVCAGSSAYTWLCSVATDGHIYLSRYGVAGSYVKMDTSTWLPFNLNFCVD